MLQQDSAGCTLRGAGRGGVAYCTRQTLHFDFTALGYDVQFAGSYVIIVWFSDLNTTCSTGALPEEIPWLLEVRTELSVKG
jgi:hypothetical protein